MYVYIHTYIHTYIHITYIHAHIHMCQYIPVAVYAYTHMHGGRGLRQAQPSRTTEEVIPDGHGHAAWQIEGKDRPLSRSFHAACVVDDR